ncbi:hypothetical protein AAK899_06120 [Erysipelotrichaceae bacterium 51-3]|uniref:hypothetical protein n=1 Tax=Allobaculum sp. JKK-2023 TaxID=3108943 RepID=UPI002B061741|nr:hypothetical protein [Allobaculum sp. JKK-2023]
MTRTTTSKQNTNLSKLIALATSLSIAAVVGYTVLKPSAPVVQAHAYTNENKIVAVSSQKVLKASVETPEQPAENK